MRAKQFVPIVEAQQELFEVNMSPGNLKKLASGIDALVGIEFEMIVPDVGSVDDDDREPEEDMDYDEEAYDIDDITRFFNDGDYNDRSTIRDLEEELREKFYEWQSEQIDEQWNSSDGRQFFAQWVKDNVGPDEVADHVDKEEDLFGNRNPDGSDWDQFIEDEWEKSFDSDNYQNAYDEFREDRQDNGDFDEREFLREIGIRYMSDVNDHVREYVAWPHYTYSDGDSEMNLENLADEFSDTIGRKVHYSTGYHGGPRTNDAYTIEPDSSLSGAGDDAGLEFISPPLPVDEALADVKKIKEWADERGAYTNRTTGLHMNVSVPGFDQEKLDFVKLTLLLGDKYLLDRFGRSANTYCKSAMDIIEEAPNVQDKELLFKRLKDNLETMASRVIHSGRVGKFTSINPKDNRVEFRGPGGDWLDQNFDKIEDTLYRCVVALDAAVDPEKYRKEYLKKLTKMFSPTKGSLEDVFVQYAAGTITRQELKNKLKETQSQRKKEKLSKEGVVELEFYELNDGDWIIEYDNPTGDNRRMLLKKTEQVSNDRAAMEAAMKLEPSWFNPNDIENIIVTEYTGKKVYNVFDKEGNVVGSYNAFTPLQAIDITLSYDNSLPKDELTAKLASESQPEPLRMAPGEQEFVVVNNTTNQRVNLAARDSATALSRALRNNPSWDSYQHQIRVLSATPQAEEPAEEPQYTGYRVSGSNSEEIIAAGTPGEAQRIAMLLYPNLGDNLNVSATMMSSGLAASRYQRHMEDIANLNNQSSEQQYTGYRVTGSNSDEIVAARTPEEAENIARLLYPNLGENLSVSVTDMPPLAAELRYRRHQENITNLTNQSSGNTPAPNQDSEGEFYLVSDPGDNAGGVRFRATSPEHAIERARAAFNIPADRELQARLENG
jgi:hypothetical protein